LVARILFGLQLGFIKAVNLSIDALTVRALDDIASVIVANDFIAGISIVPAIVWILVILFLSAFLSVFL